jgi:hypothetical protein
MQKQAEASCDDGNASGDVSLSWWSLIPMSTIRVETTVIHAA